MTWEFGEAAYPRSIFFPSYELLPWPTLIRDLRQKQRKWDNDEWRGPLVWLPQEKTSLKPGWNWCPLPLGALSAPERITTNSPIFNRAEP